MTWLFDSDETEPQIYELLSWDLPGSRVGKRRKKPRVTLKVAKV